MKYVWMILIVVLLGGVARYSFVSQDKEQAGDTQETRIAVSEDQTEDKQVVQEVLPMAYFENLKDGDTVSAPFTVVFGLKGMDVAPAGTYEENTGHFHLLINSTIAKDDYEYAIPSDESHIHFGKGQTETTLELEPGDYHLQIIMGDGDHMIHDKPVLSERIKVTVVAAETNSDAGTNIGTDADVKKQPETEDTTE